MPNLLFKEPCASAFYLYLYGYINQGNQYKFSQLLTIFTTNFAVGNISFKQPKRTYLFLMYHLF